MNHYAATWHVAKFLYIYMQRKIFFRGSFFLYSPCHYMRAWIRILDARGCYATKLWIGRNCRAVCTKKSGLNVSGHRYALLNDPRKSAVRFERPAKQALALATEPRAKREARSVLCHTCQ